LIYLTAKITELAEFIDVLNVPKAPVYR